MESTRKEDSAAFVTARVKVNETGRAGESWVGLRGGCSVRRPWLEARCWELEER